MHQGARSHSHPFAGVFMPSPFATPFETPPPALLAVRALGTHAAAAAAEDLLLSFSAEAFTAALSASCVCIEYNQPERQVKHTVKNAINEGPRIVNALSAFYV